MNRAYSKFMIVSAALVCALATAASASAAPADFDPSFGAGGVVTSLMAGTNDAANDIVVQPDGKIVAAVRTLLGSNLSDWTVVRYNPDGSLDTTFSGDGIQATPIGTDDYAESIALAPGGKIVVGGSALIGFPGNRRFAVARYLPDGTPDPSFGISGVRITSIGTNDFGQSVAVQPDGKIVLAGDSSFGGVTRFSAVRYLGNGDPDPAFSLDGIQTTTVGAGSSRGRAVQIQSDGKLVIAGLSDSVTAPQFTAIRYDAAGTLDPSYGGGDGIMVLQMSGTDQWINDAQLQSDGKLVIAGSSGAALNDNFAIARVNADGTPDLSFGTNSYTTTDLSSDGDGVLGIAIKPNDTIVAVGYVYSASSVEHWGIAQYSASGVLDPFFNPSGAGTLQPVLGTGKAVPSAAAIQDDGKIVIGGSSNVSGLDRDATVVRLLGSEAPLAAPPTPLSVLISSRLKGKLKAKNLKSLSGTATGTGLAKVQISLQRIDKKLLKKRKQCLFVKNSKGQTKKYRARNRKCTQNKWLTAKGTAAWSYKLKGKLKPGSYTLFVRALNASGATQSKFSTKLKNQRSFKVVK